jgi:GNAT superfamily N-acetyltransferase
MISYKNSISIDEYNQLRVAVDWKPLEVKQAEAGLKNSAYCISAYDRERAVGFARVITDKGYMALIVDVMVKPEYQEKGIGTEMLKKIMQFLETSVNSEQMLMINLMSVRGKEKFYSKFGFLERPSESMGSGMVRWLNA